MGNLKIDQIIVGDASRDAIHIAVAPVVAGEELLPGNRVEVVGGVAQASESGPGIVDPFLQSRVRPGRKFWVFLDPGSITSLRHHWEHPAFPDDPTPAAVSGTPARSEHEAWIRAFAESVGLTYGDLMEGASDWIESRYYLNRGSLLEGEYVPEEFWVHYEAVTGTSVPEDDRENFFTCSC